MSKISGHVPNSLSPPGRGTGHDNFAVIGSKLGPNTERELQVQLHCEMVASNTATLPCKKLAR